VLAPNHSHPGEEIVYIIEGLLKYQLEGIASLMISSASIVVVGSTLAAQDRYALKSPSGLSFSELRATSCGR
jgi:hypothetical protein